MQPEVHLPGGAEPSKAGATWPPQIPDHELLRRIGRGSYGEVWLARSIMGRYRAVKIISRAEFSDTRGWDREFTGLRNFEPVSRSHPNQLAVFHVGRKDEEGYFFYIMELADDCERGQEIDPEHYHPRTLESERRARGRLPFQECVQLGLTLTASLGHLHQRGLAHRDVKPSNIIFVNGIPKLADIGLVAATNAAASFVGTEGFVPPEGPGTVQADLFGLGKVLYEISMGLDRQEFPKLPMGLREWPEEKQLLELNAIALKACERDPRRRYRSAEEMRGELLLLDSGKSVKRLHRLEKRLAMAIKVGVAVGAVALLAGLGLYQERKAARSARQRLERVQVAHALQLMEKGDYSGALLWVAESLQLVKGDPAAEEMHRYRFEALWRSYPGLLTIMTNSSRLTHGEFSPDGRRVLTSCSDGTARLWDAFTGNLLRTLARHKAEIKVACFSRDGRRILTADVTGVVCVWAAETGQLVCPPILHQIELNSAALSPDGARVVTAGKLANGDGEAQVWDAEKGQRVLRPMTGLGTNILSGHTSGAPWVSFSPNGHELLLTAGNEARVLELPTGRSITPPLRHDGPVRQGNFSPDGRLVVTSSEDGTARVWDSVTGQPVGAPLRHHEGVLYAVFSPDSKHVATASRDHTARAWLAATGEPVTDSLRHGHEVRYLEFSPDGRWLATRSTDQTANVWDVRTGEAVCPALGHNSNVAFATFAPEGRRLLTCSWDGAARVWDLDYRLNVVSSIDVSGRARFVQFDPFGARLLIDTFGRKVTVWDAIRGQQERVLEEGREGGALTTLVRDHQWLICRAIPEVGVSIWDGSNYKKIATGSAALDNPGVAVVSPDQTHLATANKQGVAQVWELPSFRPVSGPLRHRSRINAMAFSPDSRRILVGTGDFHDGSGGGASLWEIATGKLAFAPVEQAGAVFTVQFSPDGKRFLTAASDGTLEGRDARVWDAATGAPVTAPLHHQEGVSHAEFSPNGTRVLTASGGTARVWDAATGAPVSPLLKHDAQVAYATFSPDGRRVLTASSDGTARVWDAATGELLAPPLRHHGPVHHGAFSPDGGRAATASEDGTVKIWELPKTALPVDELKLWAELVSGRQVDSTAGFEALTPVHLREIRDALSAKNPDAFKLPGEERFRAAGTTN
jgi:WD40 repeat protein